MTGTKKGKLTRRDVLRKGAGATGALLLGYTFLWEPASLEETWTEIPLRGLPSPFEGLVVAVVSDFHFGTGMTVEFVRRVASLIQRQKPDLILLPGDFTNSHYRPSRKELRESFAALSAPLGVYGVLGNHDHWSDPHWVTRVMAEETPVRMLQNEHLFLERNGQAIALCGTDDLRTGLYRPEQALGGLDPQMPRLLLQHQPDSAEELAQGWRVDLQISGHMHGGQNALLRGVPGFLPSRYGQKFLMGLCQGKSHRVFVTRGIGGLMPGRPRFACRPEVSFLRLVSSPLE